MIGSATGLVCLLGNPVGHSLSPAMHNAAFRHLRLDMNYMAFRVEPGRFPEALRGLDALGCLGANVTVPYKEEAFSHVGCLDSSVKGLGAVNTVVFRNGESRGYNTDVAGVQEAVALLAPRKKSVLLLGAGGAARAATLALARDGFAPLYISNRDETRARRLADDFAVVMGRPVAEVLPWGDVPGQAPGLLVNATSLGLEGNPWPKELLGRYLTSVGQGKVLDLVYSSHGQTLFVTAARLKGLEARGGEEVLLYQGAEAFRLFTGREAPLDVMREALNGVYKE